jgi:hypothetical protein
MPAILNLLIRLCFDAPSHKDVNSFCVATKKISLANFSFPSSLSPEDEVRPVYKESQNGLESPEDRRSAGRHGNQHVCVRRPQISGCDCFTFDGGGPPSMARS